MTEEKTKVEDFIIFRWYYTHPITKKIIRPKNGKPFPIKIKAKA